jgi:hypothetical protein
MDDKVVEAFNRAYRAGEIKPEATPLYPVEAESATASA